MIDLFDQENICIKGFAILETGKFFLIFYAAILQNVETTNWKPFIFHSLFSGRRRVSLSRNTQLKHCPNSASSHYFSICKLNLAIPIILLLLSTTFDVTGEWFEFSFSSGFLISQTNISSIVNLLLFSRRIRNIPSFIKHFDHISVAVCREREELSSCRVNNRNKSKK